MRIMGIDYGRSHVGVAVSDELLLTASGIEVIHRKHENKLRQTYARIEHLLEEHKVSSIVVGYPKNMDNSIGASALKAQAFADAVQRRTGLLVELWDERLTTVSAHRILKEGGLGLAKRMASVDMVAAVFILQGYLDYLANRPK